MLLLFPIASRWKFGNSDLVFTVQVFKDKFNWIFFKGILLSRMNMPESAFS